MTTLRQVYTVHPLDKAHRAPGHVESLTDAYRRGDDVPPVVAIRYQDGAIMALNGTHRIAALSDVFGDDANAAEYLEIYDGDSLYEIADGQQVDALDRIASGRFDPEHVRALLPLFEDEDAQHLAEQWD